MKTYPIYRENGSLNGFEMPNTWISLKTLKKLLRSVKGVAEVNLCKNSDDRLEFIFKGESCVVHEPFGDNSRYWVGSKEPQNSKVDIAPIESAIKAYQYPITKFWKKISAIFDR